MNNTGIEPFSNKILVRPEPVEETTKGGIIIAETIRDRTMLKQTRGEVIAMGPIAGEDYGPFAEVGDDVMFARYGGIVVKGKDGEDYRILNDSDITARIEKGVSFDGDY